MILLFFLAFFGFAIGRLGDKWGGHLNVPHHWIYGIILIFLGIFYSIGLISIGIGLFVSDLKDFLAFRLCGPDSPKDWRFWDID